MIEMNIPTHKYICTSYCLFYIYKLNIIYTDEMWWTPKRDVHMKRKLIVKRFKKDVAWKHLLSS